MFQSLIGTVQLIEKYDVLTHVGYVSISHRYGSTRYILRQMFDGSWVSISHRYGSTEQQRVALARALGFNLS